MLNDLKQEFDAVFEKQLLDLLRNRYIYQQLKTAWQRYEGQPVAGDLHWFMWQSYLAFICTVVRKMVDPNPTRSHSLRNCLSRLKAPESLAAVTRAQYVARYPLHSREKIGNRDFDLISRGAPELTSDVIDEDIRVIEQVAAPVKAMVDTIIAHTDRTQQPATMIQLEGAIDTLTAVYDRYAMLVGAARPGGYDFDNLVQVKDDITKVWP